MKLLKKIIYSIAIFTVITIALMNIKPEMAYAGVSSLSFGPSGSTVGTFLQSGDNIATFQISPGVAATGYMICMTFPSGTVLSTGNMAATDFVVEQNSVTVGPNSLNLSWAPTICLQMTTAFDADSPITIRLSNSDDGETYASGNELQLPIVATNSGTFTLRAPYLGNDYTLSNVSLVPDVATQILVETEADGTGTVVPDQNLWIGNSLTVYSITRDQYDNFIGNTAGTWSLQGKTGGVVNGDLVPNGDNKNAVFTGGGEGTTTIRATSGSLTATDSQTITVVEGFCRGNGTEGSPYEICNWNNLNNVRSRLDSYFILMNDLTADSADYATYASETANAEAGWEPIGTYENPFTGSFDGNGNTIRNLFIYRPAGSRVGLFGYSSGAVLDNIGLDDVNITGGSSVGGLLGDLFDSSVTNSYSTGNVTGTNNYVGGLVGNAFGNITNSYSSASVSASNTVGGLVGKLFAANITSSYSSGSVSGSSNVGGLLGTITSASVINSFYDSQTSGQSDTGKGTPKTTSEMKTSTTFTGASWDFVGTWAMDDEHNSGYAYLQSLTPIAIWNLSYIAGDNGNITGDSSQTVNNGENGSSVTAVPSTGYHFVKWSDDIATNPRTDTGVTGNVTVTANFAVNTYTLSYSVGDNGSLTGTTSQTVNYGGDGSAVTAVPNSNYAFVKWSDDSYANPRTDLDVTANISVTATFAIIDPDAPVRTVFEINDGANQTKTKEVTLTIEATDAQNDVTHMVVCSTPSFTNCDWESYATTKSWTLSDEDGVKDIYIKFKDAVGNESLIYSSSIILDTQINLVLKETVDEEETNFIITDEGKRITYDRRPTFSGTGEIGATVNIVINSDPITGSTTVDSNGNWSWTPEQDIPIEEHSVTITIQDLAGNTEQVGYVLSVLEAKLTQTGGSPIGLMVMGMIIMMGSIGITKKKHW